MFVEPIVAFCLSYVKDIDSSSDLELRSTLANSGIQMHSLKYIRRVQLVRKNFEPALSSSLLQTSTILSPLRSLTRFLHIFFVADQLSLTNGYTFEVLFGIMNLTNPIVTPEREDFRNVGLPQYLIDSAKVLKRVTFDPKKHLNINLPQKILSMKDIGYEGLGISTNAVSDPFSLFTEEAVQQMRAEVFDERTIAEFHRSSEFAAHQIRGYVPQ